MELALKLRHEIAILELAMPELDGLEATRQIKTALPDTEVLIFTMHYSVRLVADCRTAGVRGYILKRGASREIISAVEALSEGRSYFSWRLPVQVKIRG